MGSILIQKPHAEGGSTEILKVFRHFQSHCGLKVRTVPNVHSPGRKGLFKSTTTKRFTEKSRECFQGIEIYSTRLLLFKLRTLFENGSIT